MTARKLRLSLLTAFFLALVLFISWTLYLWYYLRPHRVDAALLVAKQQVFLGEGLPSVCTTLNRLHWPYVNNPDWQFNHPVANGRTIIANPPNKRQPGLVIYFSFRQGKLVSLAGAIEDAAF